MTPDDPIQRHYIDAFGRPRNASDAAVKAIEAAVGSGRGTRAIHYES
jgi:hypothetical protein